MNKYLDFIGQEIKLGDHIVYPVRRRSDMQLKKAVVAEQPNDDTYTVLRGIVCINETGRRILIRHPKRCIVINRLEMK